MVPHSCVIESLDMTGIAKNVNIFGKIMKFWRLHLTCGAKALRKVPIKRDFSRGCAISPFLFVTVHILLTHTENS